MTGAFVKKLPYGTGVCFETRLTGAPQHEVPDIEVGRHLLQPLGDLVGRADNEVALLNDRIHLARQGVEPAHPRDLRDLADDPGALGGLAGVARRIGEARVDMQAAAIKIFRRLAIEPIGLRVGLSDADKL